MFFLQKILLPVQKTQDIHEQIEANQWPNNNEYNAFSNPALANNSLVLQNNRISSVITTDTGPYLFSVNPFVLLFLLHHFWFIEQNDRSQQ